MREGGLREYGGVKYNNLTFPLRIPWPDQAQGLGLKLVGPRDSNLCDHDAEVHRRGAAKWLVKNKLGSCHVGMPANM